MKNRKLVWLMVALALIAVLSLGLTACEPKEDDNPPEPNPSVTKVPSKIKDIEDRTVDLFGDDLVSASREVSYVLTDYVKDANASNVKYELTATSQGIAAGKVKNNKFTVTVSAVGEQTFQLKVSQNDAEVFTLSAKITVEDSSVYNIVNGGFETGDLTGWTVSDNSGFVIASNSTYFDFLSPVPTTNFDGDYYLDGFNQADGFSGEVLTGTLVSSDFVVGGSRWISFKLGGGARAGLRVELVDKQSDDVIAVFNNYLFSDPYRSLGLTQYAYRIAEEYVGKTCFIRIVDEVTDGSFKSITADSFRTYYAEGTQPVIDNENVFEANHSKAMLKAHLDVEHATRSLPNGDFETGDLSGWLNDGTYGISDATTFFENFFPDNIPSYNKQGTYFVTSEGNYDAKGTLTSKAFVVGGNRVVSFKLGGNKTDNLYVSLMKYVEGSDDVEIAKFNNTMFSDPYRSVALTTYVYTIPQEYENEKCYFVLCDNATSETTFGVLTADAFKTDYEDAEIPVVDGVDVFPASYIETPVIDLEQRLGLDSATKNIRNGDFETGDMTGWFTLDLGDAYGVDEEGEYFDTFYPLNIPRYAVDGNYFLTGCKFNENEAGLNAVGVIYSQAFVVEGTGWITFKMGGTNDAKIKLQLMHYVADGDDEVVAQFNNYLFSDPYRSMGMTTYAYKIDQTLMGEKCYFKLVDDANNDTTFGAASLDSVKTYYAEDITVFDGAPMAITNTIDSAKLSDDHNIYPAAYVRTGVTDITSKLGLETATKNLRNGDFETGDMTGWFTDTAGYNAYVLSQEEKYFEVFYPDNVPVYHKQGQYFLNGFGNEGYTGNIYSQAFVVEGSRWITFRLGGNKTDNLKFKLMAYVNGIDDVEVAVFNNYLFADPYRSFGMTEYAYQIPEEYAGAKCYFVISDEGTADFGAITLDAVVTYYEQAPDVYHGSANPTMIDDNRIYPAGFKTAA